MEELCRPHSYHPTNQYWMKKLMMIRRTRAEGRQKTNFLMDVISI